MDTKLNVGEMCQSSVHSSDITSCSFSRTGIFATSSSDHSVRLWSLVETGLEEIAVLRGHKYGVNYCQFSPQGTLLASCSTDSTTVIWDTSNITSNNTSNNTSDNTSNNTSNNTSDNTSNNIIWDVNKQEKLASLVQPSGCGVRVCKFCPQSAFIATAGFLVFV